MKRMIIAQALAILMSYGRAGEHGRDISPVAHRQYPAAISAAHDRGQATSSFHYDGHDYAWKRTHWREADAYGKMMARMTPPRLPYLRRK